MIGTMRTIAAGPRRANHCAALACFRRFWLDFSLFPFPIQSIVRIVGLSILMIWNFADSGRSSARPGRARLRPGRSGSTPAGRSSARSGSTPAGDSGAGDSGRSSAGERRRLRQAGEPDRQADRRPGPTGRQASAGEPDRQATPARTRTRCAPDNPHKRNC